MTGTVVSGSDVIGLEHITTLPANATGAVSGALAARGPVTVTRAELATGAKGTAFLWVSRHESCVEGDNAPFAEVLGEGSWNGVHEIKPGEFLCATQNKGRDVVRLKWWSSK